MTMKYQGSRVSVLIPGFLIVFTHNGLMLLKGMPVNSTKYPFFKLGDSWDKPVRLAVRYS